MRAEAAPSNSICAQCGAAFRCGMQAGDEECWCARLPQLLPLSASQDGSPAPTCLCPACLAARLAEAAKANY